ncbi:MAG: hypothetical protein IKP12_05130 [Acholeplasmatales bacterium]|nr:hypothetical protein [Acholeplasmatales bacterium]
MDLMFCGIVDIVIVLGAIIMLIVGYKKGFITKILSIASILLIIVFSFLFATTLTGYLKEWGIIYPDILKAITNNINNNLGGKQPEGTTTTALVANILGTNEFFAGMIVRMMGSNVPEEANELISVCAETVTRWICNVISFFIIVIGVILVICIAKLIAAIMRENKVFKFVDGIFGILLYEVIYVIILSLLFIGLYYLYTKANITQLNDFINVDFQMETDKFRLSKWFMENNLLKKIFTLIFGG